MDKKIHVKNNILLLATSCLVLNVSFLLFSLDILKDYPIGQFSTYTSNCFYSFGTLLIVLSIPSLAFIVYFLNQITNETLIAKEEKIEKIYSYVLGLVFFSGFGLSIFLGCFDICLFCKKINLGLISFVSILAGYCNFRYFEKLFI